MLPALAQSNPEILTAINENPDAFMQMLAESGVGGGAGGGAGAGAGMNMDGIGADPQALQMFTALAQNPEMLQQVLPEIEQANPELAAALRENPQGVLRMMQMMQAQGGVPGMGGAGGPGGAGPTVVRLTPEENEAVERLTQLGFDRQTAAQAYLACDKDENLAANFLFENAGGD